MISVYSQLMIDTLKILPYFHKNNQLFLAMKTIYAFLVAINNYPDPQNRLEGCVNDLTYLQSYLKEHFDNDGFNLVSSVLIDEQATRENIIKGFAHFDAAVDGDICLFFYAGHGSQWAAPEAFWHIEPDRLNECLVCWDSRENHQHDIMDKELSYLIWKTTHNKRIHFLAIMDCCHSGSNTRKKGVKVRRIEKREEPVPITSYLGFETYKKVGENAYTPPRGRHIQVAAAKARETAKEVFVKGESRGIFTYCLIEALTNSHHQISYSNLISRINIRLKNVVKNQTAQLDAFETNDKDLFFLIGESKFNSTKYLIGYDKSFGWILNAGAVQGISVGDESSHTKLELEENRQPIEVIEVLTNSSRVKGMAGYDKKHSYGARLVQWAIPKFQVAISAQSDSKGISVLQEILGHRNSGLFKVTEEIQESRYLIQAKNGAYFLTTPYDEHPLFKPINDYTDNSANIFINCIETLANWIHVLALNHPNSSIQDSEIHLDLFRTTQAGNYGDEVNVELLDWTTPGEFEYLYHQGMWYMPAFQLKVTNTGSRNLWVSLLYLCDDCSITNQLIQKEELTPGDSIWALDIQEGIPYRTIPIEVVDDYVSRGITVIQEYLKLIICTEEFETDNLNQEGLTWGDSLGLKRALGRSKAVPRPDWTTKIIPLQTYRPIEPIEPDENQMVQFMGLGLRVPKGFRSLIALSTLDRSTGAFVQPPNELLPNKKAFIPFELGPHESRSELCALVFHEIEGIEQISIQQPLTVHFSDTHRTWEQISLWGCDDYTGKWFPLQFHLEERKLFIQQLPKPTPSIWKGWGDSAKVFFCTQNG